MNAFRISQKAIKDLENIWDYTANKWSPTQANIYHLQIIEQVENLAAGKTYGKPYTKFKIGFMYKKVGSHYVFYQKKENEVLEVVRVLHIKMDIDKRLNY